MTSGERWGKECLGWGASEKGCRDPGNRYGSMAEGRSWRAGSEGLNSSADSGQTGTEGKGRGRPDSSGQLPAQSGSHIGEQLPPQSISVASLPPPFPNLDWDLCAPPNPILPKYQPVASHLPKPRLALSSP